VLLKCHIGFRGETHSSCCRQAEGQEGPCCCKRDDDVDLRRLRQTMRLAHWSVCPFVCCLQVAPMTWGSVDLDDSVHRVCVCVCVCVSFPVASKLHCRRDSLQSLGRRYASSSRQVEGGTRLVNVQSA